MHNMVLKGKDDWLFLKNDTNDVISQITGKKPLTPTDLETWKKEIEFRNNHASKYSYKYFYMIIPNKHCVYSDKLPEGIVISPKRSAIQLSSALPDTFIYPAEWMKSNRDKMIYFKTDTHWNNLGAVITLNHYLGTLTGKQIEYQIKKLVHTGDLGNKLAPPISDESHDIEYEAHAILNYDSKIVNTGHIYHYINSNKRLPIAVIFGDSFFSQCIKLIAEYFSHVYFFHAKVFDTDIIEKIKPDIVINAYVERFVNKFEGSCEHNFKDIIYRKFFNVNHRQLMTLGNPAITQDHAFNLDMGMLHDLRNSFNSCKTSDDLSAQQYKKLYEYSQFKYIPHGTNYFSGKIWKATNTQPFVGWACSFVAGGGGVTPQASHLPCRIF